MIYVRDGKNYFAVKRMFRATISVVSVILKENTLHLLKERKKKGEIW